MTIKDIKEFVREATNNKTLKTVILKFNGWYIDPLSVIRTLNEFGYTVKINCCTFRHHATIIANK